MEPRKPREMEEKVHDGTKKLGRWKYKTVLVITGGTLKAQGEFKQNIHAGIVNAGLACKFSILNVWEGDTPSLKGLYSEESA